MALAFIVLAQPGAATATDAGSAGVGQEYVESIGFTASKGLGSKIDDAANAVMKWMGKDARVITNKAGDKVLINKAGTRRVRFDINNPSPHKSPHSHVEELVNGKWRKSGPIYPTDVDPM